MAEHHFVTTLAGVRMPKLIYGTAWKKDRTAALVLAALKAGAADYVWKDVQGHFRELLGAAIRSALQQQRMKAEAEEARVSGGGGDKPSPDKPSTERTVCSIP